MRMKNKLKRRLVKINAFLKSKKKPSLNSIHLLRLEVKHLEALLELMATQKNFAVRPANPGAHPAIPGALPANPGARPATLGRLDKLFHEAGKLRKCGLETKAILSVAENKSLSKPAWFLQQIKISGKKSSKRLYKKRKAYPPFKMRDFVKHPEAKLSQHVWRQFLSARASSIMDLLGQDIMSDIRSLHQLRKILKSILFVLPVCKKGKEPVRAFLKSNRKLLKSVESKIGSIHDTGFFINWLDKNHDLIRPSEKSALKKIKQVWHHDITRMKEELQPLLDAVRQFAEDLKDQSSGHLHIAKGMFN